MGSQKVWHIIFRKDQVLLLDVDWARYSSKLNGLQKASSSPRKKILVPLSYRLPNSQNYHTSLEGLDLSFAEFRVSKFPLAQVCSFTGFPHHGFDLFAQIFAPHSLWLVSNSYVVDFCSCCYQLLNESSHQSDSRGSNV